MHWLTALKQARRAQKLKHDLGDALPQMQHALEAVQRTGNPMPVLIVSYNNDVYTRNAVRQLQARGIKPIIIDNHSTNADTTAWLETCQRDGLAHVVRCRKNWGHMVGFLDPIYRLLPDVFAYTDPDLQFHPALPADFLQTLSQLTLDYSAYKAGFALSLDADERLVDTLYCQSKQKPFAFQRTYPIREWEAQFWQRKLEHGSLVLYAAAIDTTFAVYRKSNFRGEFLDAIRVAGEFSAVHLPWFPRLDIMSDEQRQHYLGKNTSTSWVKS